MVRGQWRDPSTTTDTLGTYALRWVVDRELSDRTRELYLGSLSEGAAATRQCRFGANHPATRQDVEAGPAGLRHWSEHGGQGLPLAPCRDEHSGR
jgi:hypothetical protein